MVNKPLGRFLGLVSGQRRPADRAGQQPFPNVRPGHPMTRMSRQRSPGSNEASSMGHGLFAGLRRFRSQDGMGHVLAQFEFFWADRICGIEVFTDMTWQARHDRNQPIPP